MGLSKNEGLEALYRRDVGPWAKPTPNHTLKHTSEAYLRSIPEAYPKILPRCKHAWQLSTSMRSCLSCRMGFFIWEEERLQARGYVTTYVLSHGSRTRAICRRQCRSTLEGILKNCQASGLETLPELKAFVKKGGTEDVGTKRCRVRLLLFMPLLLLLLLAMVVLLAADDVVMVSAVVSLFWW